MKSISNLYTVPEGCQILENQQYKKNTDSVIHTILTSMTFLHVTFHVILPAVSWAPRRISSIKEYVCDIPASLDSVILQPELCALPPRDPCESWRVLAAPLPSSPLLTQLRKQQVTVQVFGLLPHMWKIQKEFPAPDFSLVQIWLVQSLGEWNSKWKTPLFL